MAGENEQFDFGRETWSSLYDQMDADYPTEPARRDSTTGMFNDNISAVAIQKYYGDVGQWRTPNPLQISDQSTGMDENMFPTSESTPGLNIKSMDDMNVLGSEEWDITSFERNLEAMLGLNPVFSQDEEGFRGAPFYQGAESKNKSGGSYVSGLDPRQLDFWQSDASIENKLSMLEQIGAISSEDHEFLLTSELPKYQNEVPVEKQLTKSMMDLDEVNITGQGSGGY